ncbi:hypothetical protein EC968_002271 [Mortierella alpina]|nr:hypothetical protein EC968_002271 [Mortierella alpina]
MTRSAAHTFFEIPELVVLLSAHVSVPDLARCVLVCKAWLDQFRPRLWMDLHIDNVMASLIKRAISPTRDALTRHLPHIRAVNFSFANDAQLLLFAQGLPKRGEGPVMDTSTLCTNLRRIRFDGIMKKHLDHVAWLLIRLIDHNIHLTHLTLPLNLIESTEKSVFESIIKLVHLRHLTVESFHEVAYLRDPLLLLKACLSPPELTELKFINVEVYWSIDEKARILILIEAMIRAAATNRYLQGTNAKKIKSLQLPANHPKYWNPLALLLLKSDLLDLETYEIPWFPPGADEEEIEQVVREFCPNLRHLTGSSSMKGDGGSACAFIRGCTGIQSFVSSYFSESRDFKWRMIISELVSQHHGTLETFVLINPNEVGGWDLQQVLTRCRHLKRFWVISNKEAANLSGIAFWHISRSDWVCTGLRELGLTLNRCRRERDTSGDLEETEGPDDLWLAASIKQRVYQQIGRLEKLELLEIDIDKNCRARARAREEAYGKDLTLAEGWLGELVGLKRLRSLRLRADFWTYMSQAEVEFMDEHWPLLTEIRFACDIADILAKQHWQWLLRKRPQLRFRHINLYRI